MQPDVRALLDHAAGGPSSTPDFDAIAATGRRRRHRRQALGGLTSLAVLVAATAAVAPLLRAPTEPSIVLDTPPRAGAGEWELLPEGPLQPADDAQAIDLGDGEVLVVGGVVDERAGGERGTPQAAIYDVASREWTALPPVPLPLDRDGSTNAGRLLTLDTEDGTVVVWREWNLLRPLPPVEAAVFDPGGRRWIPTGPAPLSERAQPFVAWVAGRLVVWGGQLEQPRADTGDDEPASPRAAWERNRPAPVVPVGGGAVWTPAGGWRPMARFPLSPRLEAGMGVVDGRVVVWGGVQGGVDDPHRRLFADGAVYDVVSDKWTVLPDAGLSPRSHPAIVGDGDGFLLFGGSGEVTVTEYRGDATLSDSPPGTGEEPAGPDAADGPRTRCTADSCAEQGTTGYGQHYSYDKPGDGARFDFGAGAWQPLPAPPDDATDVGQGWTRHVRGDGVAYRWEAGEWRRYEPHPDMEWGYEVTVGDRTVLLSSPGPTRIARLGGWVLEPGREWIQLAEAATAGRQGPAVTAIGDHAVFVWGGIGRDPEQGTDHDIVLRRHADGAVWRP